MSTNHIHVGAEYGQYRGATHIRRVRVITVEPDGTMAHVVALNGPLSGAEFDIDTDALR